MILVDANLLVYAHTDSSPHHEAARDWLDRQLNGTARVGLPWPCLLAFVRLVTNPRVRTPHLPMSDAWGQVEAWLGCEVAWVPLPTNRHAEVIRALLLLPGVGSNLVPDAHLAALAIEHGLILCSADRDFAGLPVRWLNPLTGERTDPRHP